MNIEHISTENLTVSTAGKAGELLVIALNKHSRRNAFDLDFAYEVDRAMEFLETAPGIRAGIITGANGYFSAGSDLIGGPRPITENGGEYGFVRRMRTRPLIAAVDGFALGGGFEMVLACDLVVASEDARFALPEVFRGSLAACGGVFRTANKLPDNIATEMLLTGMELSGRRAYELGFANRVTPSGEALTGALELGGSLTPASPSSVGATLEAKLLQRAEYEAPLWEKTESARATAAAAPDWQEGIDAFFDKRQPNWSL